MLCHGDAYLMIRKKAFWKKLRKEVPKWVSGGILDEDQQQKILAIYAPKKSNIPRRLPAIVIGLAVILLGVGIILFYAANWRKMPPGVKLLQVFLLMFCTYATSYYFLAIRKSSELIGRAFLLLGMVSFGAGIVLVAQIYHISAHPANGILAWSLGVLVTSWIMRERWGYYLAALLVFIWNAWEYFEYQNPNYLFVLFPLVLLYFFYKKQDKIGVLVAVFEGLFWYYQINLYWVNESSLTYVESELFAWHSIPFGLILIALGRLGEKDKTLLLSSHVITFLGWLALFIPLIALSWPVRGLDIMFPFFALSILTGEYILLLGIAAGLWYYLSKRGIEYRLAAACLLYGIWVFLLPLGNITTLMIATHLGFLAYFFGLLYSSYLYFPERRIERFLAFAFPITMILSKGIGFLMFGIDNYRFFVAYCIGFIIFGTVCLLINQTLKLLLKKKETDFPEHILNSVCALMGFCILYALSFKITEQSSVFNTTPVVLTLLGMFLIIALGLYLFHWLKNPEKLIIFLSALIFFTSVAVLVFSEPDVSWITYSVIFNASLFLMTATLLYYSTRINSAKLANFTIVGFLVHIVTRYFDLFWDMLSGSFLFIVTGLLALGGGYILEKQRRKLLKTMRQ